MGFLEVEGSPLVWGTDEYERCRAYILEHGVQQFLINYQKNISRRDSPFLWGDEIEHLLVKMDPEGGLSLSLNAADVLSALGKLNDPDVDWRPEYGSFMIESVPREPYTDALDDLMRVEPNMRRRYELVDAVAGEGTSGVTLVMYPLMGVGNFTTAGETSTAEYSQSLFVPDVCINATHPRFCNLTRNIRLRRQRKVCIQVPLFIDEHTRERTVDPKLAIDLHPRNRSIQCAEDPSDRVASRMKRFGEPEGPKRPVSADAEPNEMTNLFTPATDYYYAQYSDRTEAEMRRFVEQRYNACPCPVITVDHPCVYMDCMAFGMGCCCLQVTMQLRDIDEARYVYDQLAVLCPYFLAATSATPFQKGLLTDSDVRWLTIAASVDDRQKGEVPKIFKSRYDSVSSFLSRHSPDVAHFNDEELEVHHGFLDILKQEGVDDLMAAHVAHLFIRDPLVIFDRVVTIDDERRMEHFENIQSTNWQTVRFKPPPPSAPSIGWRVEFRVMEVMPTAFENAAFSVFVILLAKAIIKYRLRFYLRITQVDQNMGKAHLREPCKQEYYWRRDPFKPMASTALREVECVDIATIFNRPETGLVAIVRRYITEEGLTSPRLDAYVTFIARRTAGSLPTAATYLRDFVTTHADYRQDSRLTPTIAADLVKKVRRLATGAESDEAFIPSALVTAPVTLKREREECPSPGV